MGPKNNLLQLLTAGAVGGVPNLVWNWRSGSPTLRHF